MKRISIPEGWPTGRMCTAFEWAAGVEISIEQFDKGLRAAFAAAPTPPAPEVEPIYQYLSYASDEWLECSKEQAPGIQKNGFEVRVLYTHPDNDGLRKALQDLLSYAEAKICYHEETHRGGAIWEICDSCGKMWADDDGGKPVFSEPEEIKAARDILGRTK